MAKLGEAAFLLLFAYAGFESTAAAAWCRRGATVCRVGGRGRYMRGDLCGAVAQQVGQNPFSAGHDDCISDGNP